MLSSLDSWSNDINKTVYITQRVTTIIPKRAKALKGSIEIYEQIKNVIKHANPSIQRFLTQLLSLLILFLKNLVPYFFLELFPYYNFDPIR